MAEDPAGASRPDNQFERPTVVGQPNVLPHVGAYRRPFILQQIQGPGAPRDHHLELEEVIVGRSGQAHICIDSGLLSRRHVALRRNGPEYACADLDSSNGMYLNGIRAHSALLREGDMIQIGDVVFVYHEGS